LSPANTYPPSTFKPVVFESGFCTATQAEPETFGTLGRNTLRGPWYANTDISVARSFPLKFREAAKLTFSRGGFQPL
jgi:hypothetical protein